MINHRHPITKKNYLYLLFEVTYRIIEKKYSIGKFLEDQSIYVIVADKTILFPDPSFAKTAVSYAHANVLH